MYCSTAGVGKTQFCIGCCVQAVVMSNTLTSSDSSSTRKKRGGVVYIDTELKFDSMRLIDVAICRFPEIYSTEYSVEAPHQIDKFLKSVKVRHLYDKAYYDNLCVIHGEFCTQRFLCD